MTKKFIFNKNAPKLTPINLGHSFEDFSGQPMFKYAELEHVMSVSLPIVQNILKTCPLVGGFKHNLVDVKLHSLKEGECPCLFGWHLDGHPNPWKYEKPAMYHLFLIGPEFSRTLFINHPVELEVIEGTPQQVNNDYTKQLEKMDLEIVHAPESQWVTFTSEDFHSGPLITKPANRVLIRIAETNWIEPRNNIVKESFVQIVGDKKSLQLA